MTHYHKNSITAQLGFGTGSIYGRRNRNSSLALIKQAFDAGIRWFDTAPLYGHGKAEAILGEALKGKRGEVKLISKVGILPARINTAFRVQYKLSRLPLLDRYFEKPAPREPLYHQFSVLDIAPTVERSLRALRTDRLDALLLHECSLDEATSPELLLVLDKLVAEGKILTYGTATCAPVTQVLAELPESPFAIFQLASSAWDDKMARLQIGSSSGSVVIHSVLGQKLGQLMSRLSRDASLRKKARELGIDPDRPQMGSRLIKSAMQKSRVGAVLFSTTSVSHLTELTKLDAMTSGEAVAGEALVVWALEN